MEMGGGRGGDVLEKKGGEELSGKFGPETDGERSGGVSPTWASTIHQTPPRGEEKGGSRKCGWCGRTAIELHDSSRA